VRKKIPLRWKLILVAWSLAFGIAVVLTSVLHSRSQHQLLHQFEKTLEWKCDEVITVLQSRESHGMLQEFLDIETSYRSSPHVYFYQILSAHGRMFARSRNLADVELPTPGAWNESPVHIRIVPDPFLPEGRQILLRSERMELARPDREAESFVIQTAASLVPFESAVQRTLRAALLVAASGLTAVFFLLWFVTAKALRPVSAMTSKASQITAKDLRERIPLAGTSDELDELAKVLNDMLDRIGRSMRQIEQFSSDVAHEFRTPLTRIRGELDLIHRSERSGTLKAQIETVLEEVERLSRLCGRLLFLARIDQEVVDPSLFEEAVDLDEIVSEVLEQITPLALDHGLELRAGATSEVQVRGSRSLLVEALLNLIHNAIRATPDGGTVSVSIDADGGFVRLSVEDDGPGVPHEKRELIFQRFYRIPPPSIGPMDEGVGLGLAIVKAIAHAHGGRVELVNAAGGGSIFRLVLPSHTT
jgi:heavy metal sensor kinase